MRFIGPILPVTPANLPDGKKLRKMLDLDEDKPVIFAPISGPAKERAYFTGILRQIFAEFPNDYQIVMSLGYPKSSVETIKNGNLTVHSWDPYRFEHLKTCNLVVSRGGHGTISQSICYGKPLILVPTPSHTEQYNNSIKAAELGVAKIISQEVLNKNKLLAHIRSILENNTFQQNADMLHKEVVNCDGLDIATKIIANAAIRLQ